MRIAILTMAALALACCGDSAFKRRVQEAVKDQLVDPESARFSDDWYSDRENIACGAVNARNRMGGYAGKQLWVWKDHRAQIMSDVMGSDFQQINQIWEECQRARFPEQFPANQVVSNSPPPVGNGM